MGQTEFFTKSFECLVSIRHSPGITPDYGWSEHIEAPVHTDKSMHLIGNTDSSDILRIRTGRLHDLGKSFLKIVPP